MAKVYFEEELQLIKDDGIRDLVVEVLKTVKDDFFHAPASSTGKYHPDYALGDGGLYRHTRAAVKIAAVRTAKATSIREAVTTTNGRKKERSSHTCPYETGFGRV